MHPDDDEDLPSESMGTFTDPLETFLTTQNEPLPPMSPDGGFAPTMNFQPEPIPEATLENFICLRGPCRHYFEARNPFPAGNAAGTFAAPPTQTTRYCKAMTPPLDLTDEVMYECNTWHPLRSAEKFALEEARDEWWNANPEFKEGN